MRTILEDQSVYVSATAPAEPASRNAVKSRRTPGVGDGGGTHGVI
jgi:hypothetical protein